MDAISKQLLNMMYVFTSFVLSILLIVEWFLCAYMPDVEPVTCLNVTERRACSSIVLTVIIHQVMTVTKNCLVTLKYYCCAMYAFSFG